ncbi:MAG: MFS transporter [Clostridiales bacterium]|nr:MFS transporter [Clostridiales bacterium]
MRRFILNLLPQLKDIYSPGEEHSRGRLISLISSLMASFYNVFITGIFYTGFLSMYGISITGVGIVSFIPYIGSLFSLFSPFVLKKFEKRKTAMLLSKLFFYFLFIVATTLMPTFVKDTQARLYWLIGILFVAYAQYALFSPGITVWFYNFYPKENERRTRYIYFNQLFSSVMSSLVLLVSGVITDAVSGSSHQSTIILTLRYFAFFLVIIDVSAQARAKEYPYQDTNKLRLKDVFTIPIKNSKFMMCMLLMFFWNFICNLNNGTWNYHLLNHMEFGYTVINLMSVSYTVLLLVFSKLWRKLLRRLSWVKTFGLCCLLSIPIDLMLFMMSRQTRALYVPLSLWQNVINVGYNLSYANILYMNLPEGNSTSYIAFYSVGANLCAFLGMITGVYIVNLRNDAPFMFMGFEIYTVQLTMLVHVFCLLIMGLMCVLWWRRFTSDSEIKLVEAT